MVYDPLLQQIRRSDTGGGGSGTVTSVTAGNGLTATPNPIIAAGTIEVGAELAGFISLATTGIVIRTAAATYATRTLVQPAAGITISNADGVAGNPTFALANDLAALEAMSGTGLVARTASETYSQRTITGPAAGITVSNGDGVSGNPTLALANDLSALEAMSGTGLVTRTASETYAQRTITAGAGISVVDGNGVSGNPTISVVVDPTSIVWWGYQPITTSDWTATAPEYFALGPVTDLAGANSAFTANLIRAWPFLIGRSCTLSEVGIQCTGASAATNYRFAIYTNLGQTRLYPGTLLFDSGSVSTATTGFKNITSLSLSLSPGLYWGAIINNSAVPTIQTFASGAAGYPLHYQVVASPSAVTGLTLAQTFGAFPGTFATGGVISTGATTPLMVAKASA